jgi:hypothetical protein|tara:strand:- start:24 stop:866 length:843 start_codon:yes stop_codon:yes gene_type:complete
MYYPKTQVIENLFTNKGEFVISSTGEQYEGAYFKTSENRFYTGKNYQDTPNYLLELLSPGTSDFNASEIDSEKKPTSYYIIDDGYYNAKSYKVDRKSPRGPISKIPLPTAKDYQIGEFQRYFLRKPNGNLIIEVSQDEFKLFQGKDETVQWQQYQTISQSWVISGGTLKDVGSVNQTLTQTIEFRLKAYGYFAYFKGKFNQYYKINIVENLITDGTKFKNKRTGKNYAGLYHIHPSKGPMVGAKHVSTTHDYLIPIEEFQAISTVPTGSIERSEGYSGGY